VVEDKLVEAMVKDTSFEIGYSPDHLPLMQHALSWLWNNAVSAAGLSKSSPRPDSTAPSQPIMLTHDRYVTHGGLKGILNKHADELLAGLSEREQRMAQVVFTRLSERDENRYRRSPTSAAALATLADCGAAELERVVSVFSDPSVCFLDRRPLAHGADELIDVSHESLIRQWDRLRGWADEEAEKVRSFASSLRRPDSGNVMSAPPPFSRGAPNSACGGSGGVLKVPLASGPNGTRSIGPMARRRRSRWRCRRSTSAKATSASCDNG
jgi:hypothetical protein